MRQKINFFLLLAFIEGASVMACELMGAKLVAPFFGSSMYVWSSVMGVTLLALMLGYYLGGHYSQKYRSENFLYWILLFAGVLLAIMPHSSVWVMTKNIDTDLRYAASLSLSVFMLPALVFMGMTSPVIINLINSKLDETGRSAGKVYAISTLGGILATYLVGFYLMPEFGITWPSIFFGLVLLILPLIMLVKAKKMIAILVVLPLFFITLKSSKKTEENYGQIKLLHESEGMLGQIRVFDLPFLTTTRGWRNGRVLSVNNTFQSQVSSENPKYNLWDWSILFSSIASVKPEGSDLLLMGLGGGMLYHQFDRSGFEIDVVEFDERIKDLAIKYFAVPSNENIIVDDARRYINTCKKKYDVIMLDLFYNETPPMQVPTKESFASIKKMLNKKGLVLMNFYGYTTGEKGRAARSVIKTFEEVGFDVNIFRTPGEEEYSNLVICASLGQPDWNNIRYSEPDLYTIVGEDVNRFRIDKSTMDFSDAVVLTDKKPELEKMYVNAALEWRRNQISFVFKQLEEAKVKMVK